jgi:integrase
VAYVQRRKTKNGAVSYRAFYKTADGRWRSAGTFTDPDRALEVATAAEEHSRGLVEGVPPELDPVTKATMTIAKYIPSFMRHHRVEGNSKDGYASTLRRNVVPFIGGARLAEFSRTGARNYVTALIEEGRSPNTIRKCKVVLGALFAMAVAEGYLDENPFHDLSTPRVRHAGPIEVMTQPQFVKVRKALPNAPLRVFATVLVSSGIRPCEAKGLRPEDFDFAASVIKVNRSIVSVSREHHPEGKTFLVRDYTKNGTTRRVPVDSGCIAMVKDHIARYGFARGEIIFPAELLVPLRPNSDTLTEQEMAALGFCEPVNGQVYRHGTMGGYIQAKCRCEGCRQWSRQYARERKRAKAGRGRWEKSRDADEPYLREQQWSKIWNAALKKSGIAFKPTAYQVRHTHGSWLIDAGENPKVVMGRLGHGDLPDHQPVRQHPG